MTNYAFLESSFWIFRPVSQQFCWNLRKQTLDQALCSVASKFSSSPPFRNTSGRLNTHDSWNHVSIHTLAPLLDWKEKPRISDSKFFALIYSNKLPCRFSKREILARQDQSEYCRARIYRRCRLHLIPLCTPHTGIRTKSRPGEIRAENIKIGS